MERLGFLDSVFVTMELPSTPTHVAALIELEPTGTSDPEERFLAIRHTINERLSNIGVLRRRVIRAPFDLAPPVFVEDPEFDITFHVIRRALPSPGGDDQLDELIARLMARPLAPDRPLWEISVVEGLANGATALLIKIHHAIADGISGVTVFANLFDLSPEPRQIEPSQARPTPSAVPSPLELLARSSSEILRRPSAVVESLGFAWARLGGRLEEVMAAVSGSSDGREERVGILKAPKTLLGGTISHGRTFERIQISLPEVKMVSKRHGGTVTDFVMTVVGGAVKHYLKEHNGDVDEDLIAFVPVNVRPTGEESELGNRISARLSSLFTNIADPFERFEHLARESKMAKANGDKHGDALGELAKAVGPTVAHAAGQFVSSFELFDHLPHGANVIVSSVPGPTFPLWCAGQRMGRVTPIGPLMFNQGLNVTVLSYCDHLDIGMLGCAKRVANPARLRELMEEQIQILLGEEDEMGG